MDADMFPEMQKNWDAAEMMAEYVRGFQRDGWIMIVDEIHIDQQSRDEVRLSFYATLKHGENKDPGVRTVLHFPDLIE